MIGERPWFVCPADRDEFVVPSGQVARAKVEPAAGVGALTRRWD